MKRVTLLTDFGTVDGYVGVMKGVLASMVPGAFLDDISHEIPPGDVRKASRVLGRAWKEFPRGTVHLVVVDPGVGTRRRGLAVKAGGHFFVAPDNGVLSGVLSAESGWVCVVLEDVELPGMRFSRTFHGRDLFAPAAGRLAAGTPLSALGQRISDPVHLPDENMMEEGLGEGWGHVVEVDRFGNLALNLPADAVRKAGGVMVEGYEIPLRETYGEGEEGTLLAVVNSDGLVEIALRDGSAALRLGLVVGARVRLRS